MPAPSESDPELRAPLDPVAPVEGSQLDYQTSIRWWEFELWQFMGENPADLRHLQALRFLSRVHPTEKDFERQMSHIVRKIDTRHLSKNFNFQGDLFRTLPDQGFFQGFPWLRLPARELPAARKADIGPATSN